MSEEQEGIAPVELDLSNPFGMPEFDGTERDGFSHALEMLVKTPEGRTLIWGGLSQAGIYRDEFNGNSRDTYEKGKRSIGLWLLSELDIVDTTVYPRMLLDVARRQQQADKETGT